MSLEIHKEDSLVAYCGLYCGTCKKFKNNKCAGCTKNEKLSWCKIRDCNRANGFTNCAQCPQIKREKCKTLNNSIGKVFEFVFRTDRQASLRFIREHGEECYSEKMRSLGQMSFKKGQIKKS